MGQTVNRPPTEQIDGSAVDAQGNVYVIGTFTGSIKFTPTGPSTTAQNSDVFFAKYTSTGTFVWGIPLVGGLDDTGQDIAIDINKGDVYITGQFGGTLNFNPSGNAPLTTTGSRNWAFIAKYNTNGQYIWAKTIGTCDNCSSQGNAITVSNLGYIAVGGEITPSLNINSAVADFGGVSLNPNTGGAWVATYTLSGGLLWAKNFGNNTADDTPATCKDVAVFGTAILATGRFSTENVDFDSGPGTLVKNSSNGNAYVAKFNDQGVVSWVSQAKIGAVPNDAFGDTGEAISVDGNGNTYTIMSNDQSIAKADIAVAKFTLTGALGFKNTIINSGGYDSGYGIAAEASGIFYITGFITGTGTPVNFNNSVPAVNVTVPQGRNDIFIARYSAEGACFYARGLGINGFGENAGKSDVISVLGNLVVTGRFSTATDFDPCYTAPLLTPTTIDGFVASFRKVDPAIGISGPAYVCDIAPSYSTFTLNDVSPYAIIGWSQTSNITPVSGQGTPVYTVRSISSGTGSVSVTINGSSSCGTVAVAPFNVWAGTPDGANQAKVYMTQQYGVNPITLAASSAYNFAMEQVAGATYYNWFPPSGFTELYFSQTTLSAFRTADVDGSYRLVCQPANSCGVSTGSRFLRIIISGGGIQQRVAFPNPASTTITVTVKQEDSKEEAQVSIFNKNFESVFYLQTHEKEISIPINNIPDGNYFLHIYNGSELIQKQIVIKH